MGTTDLVAVGLDRDEEAARLRGRLAGARRVGSRASSQVWRSLARSIAVAGDVVLGARGDDRVTGVGRAGARPLAVVGVVRVMVAPAFLPGGRQLYAESFEMPVTSRWIRNWYLRVDGSGCPLAIAPFTPETKSSSRVVSAGPRPRQARRTAVDVAATRPSSRAVAPSRAVARERTAPFDIRRMESSIAGMTVTRHVPTAPAALDRLRGGEGTRTGATGHASDVATRGTVGVLTMGDHVVSLPPLGPPGPPGPGRGPFGPMATQAVDKEGLPIPNLRDVGADGPPSVRGSTDRISTLRARFAPTPTTERHITT